MLLSFSIILYIKKRENKLLLNNLIDEKSIYKTSPERTILQNLIDFGYEFSPLFYNHCGNVQLSG